jgi:hypothetical protein
MVGAKSKVPREDGEAGGEPRLDDDSFRCVLEALGYSQELSMCACLNKRTSLVATKLMSESRKKAVEASGHVLLNVDEKVYNRFILHDIDDGGAVFSQTATWIVEGKAGDTVDRVVRMGDCEGFVRENFPVKTVSALSDHLPLFRGEKARRSICLASSASDIPSPFDPFPSPLELIKINARMLTCDPGLHLSVSGLVHANASSGIEMWDAASSDGRFLGKLRCHAAYVHWTGCRASCSMAPTVCRIVQQFLPQAFQSP